LKNNTLYFFISLFALNLSCRSLNKGNYDKVSNLAAINNCLSETSNDELIKSPDLESCIPTNVVNVRSGPDSTFSILAPPLQPTDFLQATASCTRAANGMLWKYLPQRGGFASAQFLDCGSGVTQPPHPPPSGTCNGTVTNEPLQVHFPDDGPSVDLNAYRNVILKVFKVGSLTLKFVAGSADSGQAPYGARLFSAQLNGTELLYKNEITLGGISAVGQKTVFANPSQFGLYPSVNSPGHEKRRDIRNFNAFAGIETAFPHQEHGRYANKIWAYKIECSQGNWAFTATEPETGLQIKTRIDSNSWTQEIIAGVNNFDQFQNRSFWTNVILPAGYQGRTKIIGGGDGPFQKQIDNIEVILPSLDRGGVSIDKAQVHSAQGDPWGREGAELNLSDARFPNRENGWIGWFIHPKNQSKLSCFGMYNQNNHSGNGQAYSLTITDESNKGFFPKFFCGREITAGLSGNIFERADGASALEKQKLYCEMWFSPNVRTFFPDDDAKRDLPTFNGFKVKFTPSFQRKSC
jgi:hypothetical protein